MKHISRLLLIVSVTLFSGCCTSHEDEDLYPVNVDQAMASLARGFREMKKELAGQDGKEQNTGLVASEAEIVLNITRAKTKGDKFMIELGPPPTIPAAGKVGYEQSARENLNAGNTITIKFKSVLLSKTTTVKEKDRTTVIVEGLTDPDMLRRFYDILDISPDK